MNQLELFAIANEPPKFEEEIRELRESGDPEALSLFRKDVFLALLSKNQNKYSIVDQVVKQAKEKGLSYVLCKVSEEAKRFHRLAREVGAERYRATAFMRLQPIDLAYRQAGQHNVLFGEFEIKHQTGELIMLHFMKRFPRYNIMIVFGDEVYIGRNQEIFREKINRKKVDLPKEKDEFEKYWLAFYRSQFIPERKNLRYLKRMIPKKYWKWVTELKEFGMTY